MSKEHITQHDPSEAEKPKEPRVRKILRGLSMVLLVTGAYSIAQTVGADQLISSIESNFEGETADEIVSFSKDESDSYERWGVVCLGLGTLTLVANSVLDSQRDRAQQRRQGIDTYQQSVIDEVVAPSAFLVELMQIEGQEPGAAE